MESLLSKLTSLGYEVIGLMVPGFFGVLALAGVVLVNLVGLGHVEAAQVLALYRSAFTDHYYPALLALIVGCYLAGHGLKWVSKGGFWFLFRGSEAGAGGRTAPGIVTDWKRFLFLLPLDIARQGHRSELSGLRVHVTSRLAEELEFPEKDRSTLDDWGTFYFVAKTFLSDLDQPTLVANYQNKYTLHRSLATLCAMILWSALASLVIVVMTGPSSVFVLSVTWLAVAMAAYVLLRLFSRSFLRFWGLLGDVVIAELAVALRRAEGDVADD